MNQGLLAVGAQGCCSKNSHGRGKVHVFRRDGDRWEEEEILVSEDRDPNDRFGRAISAGENRILVGAPFENDLLPEESHARSGGAYVFECSDGTWRQTHKISSRSIAPGDNFGWSVALEGDVALVSC